jgi:hypothetical protein
MVPVIGVLPKLVAVKEGTLPVPDAAKPIAVFELLQVKLTPPGVPKRVLRGITNPSSTDISVLELTVPTGLTVTVNVAVSVAHCPGELVNV